MESLGITELEYVYMSLEAESKRAVKIGLFQKKNRRKCIYIWWHVVFLAFGVPQVLTALEHFNDV